jgi:tRNA A37 threonylcarbamoyladenosine synthetase subunit TsaC/SUA5/YrdC
VQTDTTVGFVSQNAAALAACKSRPPAKPFLKTFASLKDYKRTGRIPARFKREVRRAKKRTYVVADRAFRIVSEGPYHELLVPYGWLYSTSANAAGQRFDPAFAHARAAAVIEDSRGLYEDAPSRIDRLNLKQKRRIR